MFGKWPRLTFGTFLGAPVRLDITFLIVPALFLYVFSNWGIAESWPILVSLMLILFLSVLLHEFGHAAAARHFRVGVNEIVVGGFFGYASLKRKTLPRISRVLIIAAGPAVNLILFLLVWPLLPTSPFSSFALQSSALVYGGLNAWALETLRFFAFVNLAMFIGNLLPAYPLDGGRIVIHMFNALLPQSIAAKAAAVVGVLTSVVIIYFGAGFGSIVVLFGAYLIFVNASILMRRSKKQPRRSKA